MVSVISLAISARTSMDTRTSIGADERRPAPSPFGRRTQATTTNRLLNSLPKAELDRLLPLFERVAIAPKQVLHHRNLPMEHVYFIESGLISVMAKIGDRHWVEVWLVGSDGTTAIPVTLGDDTSPHRRVVQIGGTALRIATPDFRRILQTNTALRETVLKSIRLALLQTSQSGACNAQHTVMQRLARWLLVARDALGSGRVPLPQQMLSRLIGVRRATISDCLAEMERRELIRSSRCLVEIADAAALETIACDCYRILKKERHRLLG
jgi:CRP-like cAMP-binding protein